MNDSIDQQARALLDDLGTPRRRARPRIARSLADVEATEVQTAYGPIAAWRLGEGPAVLLVHGWEDDHALWTPAIDKFAAWGRAVVAFDLPGHGFSQAEAASVESAGAAVKAVAQALGPIEAMVGHSFGCPSIVQALSQGAQAQRVVMIATPMPRSQPRKPVDPSLAPPEVIARANEIRAEGARAIDAIVSDRLRALTSPALIIHSLDDETCAFENSVMMAGLWRGSELHPVDGLGHRIIAQDDDVLERVVAFVEGGG